MLSAWQWAALAAVVPAIISLYFLKLKRRPVEVPSTYLWKKSIEDLHVNSIWQRLRRSLLLLLQLFLLVLLMFALLRPSWKGQVLVGGRYIFLIDHSASMSATDVEPTRLDEAKRAVGSLIDQMQEGDVAMIVAFSDEARIASPYTDNRVLLRERLASIRPSNRSTSLRQALQVCSGLANPGRIGAEASDVQVAEAKPAQLFIYSDGKFDDVNDFSLGHLYPENQPPVYRLVGSDAPVNVAITSLAPRRNDDRKGRLQAFLGLENFSDRDLIVGLELELDGQLADAASVDLDAGAIGGEAFDLADLDDGVLHARIASVTDREGKPVADALPIDNEAWAVVTPPSRARVMLVTPGNAALLVAMSTSNMRSIADISTASPDILATGPFQQQCADGTYDLVIYDRCVPPIDDDPNRPLLKMPRANTLFIGSVPPAADAWKPRTPMAGLSVIDVARGHPIMQWVEISSDIQFAEGTPVDPPPGGAVLIDSDGGPLFSIGPRGAFEDAVLGAPIILREDAGDVLNTNWVRRPGFPSWVYGVIAYLGGGDADRGTENVRPGANVPLRRTNPNLAMTVAAPDGKETTLRGDAEGGFLFNATDAVGVYSVREGDARTGRFAVNLFDTRESDVRLRKGIQIGNEELEGRTAWEPARRETWKYLLVAALFVLVVEWYIYNRRVYL